jgi:hypothetical protein
MYESTNVEWAGRVDVSQCLPRHVYGMYGCGLLARRSREGCRRRIEDLTALRRRLETEQTMHSVRGANALFDRISETMSNRLTRRS